MLPTSRRQYIVRTLDRRVAPLIAQLVGRDGEFDGICREVRGKEIFMSLFAQILRMCPSAIHSAIHSTFSPIVIWRFANARMASRAHAC